MQGFPLTGPEISSKNKPTKSLVVFLHGLGADGHDLIDIGQGWSKSLPQAAFLSPHAPLPCDMSPMGYQWFSLQDFNVERIIVEVRKNGDALIAWLGEELKKRDLDWDQLALVGFSQGGLMAVYAGLMAPKAPAAVISYAGGLWGVESLIKQPNSKPPLFMAHGTYDTVVPFQLTENAVSYFESHGVHCQKKIQPGLAHGIDQELMVMGSRFIKDNLGNIKTTQAV